jgi:hypothetical protein
MFITVVDVTGGAATGGGVGASVYEGAGVVVPLRCVGVGDCVVDDVECAVGVAVGVPVPDVGELLDIGVGVAFGVGVLLGVGVFGVGLLLPPPGVGGDPLGVGDCGDGVVTCVDDDRVPVLDVIDVIDINAGEGVVVG